MLAEIKKRMKNGAFQKEKRIEINGNVIIKNKVEIILILIC